MLTEKQKKWIDSIQGSQNLMKILNEAHKAGKIEFSQYKEIMSYKHGNEMNIKKWRKG